jgi:proteic killer suppression protein
MIIEFEKEYLRELYETGSTTDKKYRFQPDIVKRYQSRIMLLKWQIYSQSTLCIAKY